MRSLQPLFPEPTPCYLFSVAAHAHYRNKAFPWTEQASQCCVTVSTALFTQGKVLPLSLHKSLSRSQHLKIHAELINR